MFRINIFRSVKKTVCEELTMFNRQFQSRFTISQSKIKSSLVVPGGIKGKSFNFGRVSAVGFGLGMLGGLQIQDDNEDKCVDSNYDAEYEPMPMDFLIHFKQAYDENQAAKTACEEKFLHFLQEKQKLDSAWLDLHISNAGSLVFFINMYRQRKGIKDVGPDEINWADGWTRETQQAMDFQPLLNAKLNEEIENTKKLEKLAKELVQLEAQFTGIQDQDLELQKKATEKLQKFIDLTDKIILISRDLNLMGEMANQLLKKAVAKEMEMDDSRNKTEDQSMKLLPNNSYNGRVIHFPV